MNFLSALSKAELSSRTIKMSKKIVSEAFMVPVNEIPRVLFHAIILFNIIGGFWLLDSLKDPILAGTIGMQNQPLAKFFSVIFTLMVVCFYDCTASFVSKTTLFHIVSGLYGTAILIIAALLSDPQLGFNGNSINHNSNEDISDIGSNTSISGGNSTGYLIGWLSYFVIESYGSLMVALFWSFTNSIMDLEQAKGAYGLIIAFAQVGAIFGSTLATTAGKAGGVPSLCLIGAFSIYSVTLLVKTYHLLYGDSRDKTRVSAVLSSPHSTGFFEGIQLICRHQYVLRLLGVCCLYEIVLTVLDYEFKILSNGYIEADTSYLSSLHLQSNSGSSVDEAATSASSRFTSLMGRFGQTTNAISLLVSVFGFSYLVKTLEVQGTLLIFPSVLLLAVVFTNLLPVLWLVFLLVSLLKALTYSLGDPVKELLYIPTSDAIKFRAKAWIDVFGARLAKGIGSFITYMSHGELLRLRVISEMPCIAICLGYLFLAWQIGGDFQKLVTSGKRVGETDQCSESVVDLYQGLPEVDGLHPGDVGYRGYNPELFEGVEFSSICKEEDEVAGIEEDYDEKVIHC